MIAAEVQSGIDAGVFREQAARDAALLVFSAVQTFTFRWLVQGKKGSLSAKAGPISELLIKGISA